MSGEKRVEQKIVVCKHCTKPYVGFLWFNVQMTDDMWKYQECPHCGERNKVE